MSVGAIIRRVCKPCRQLVHRARARCVESVAEAIALSGRLSPARIGRSVAGPTKPKHSIKRIDRLLGNTRLHQSRWRYYQAMAQQLLGATERPVVIVDWSGVTKGFHTLSAATPIGGRAVTLYAEVWPESKYANRGVQQRFLQALQGVLGHERCPIIVADAGFRVPFMDAVRRLGWDYVIRVRGPLYVRPQGQTQWTCAKEFHALATLEPTALGVHRLTRERNQFVTPPVDTNLVLVRKARPKRRRPYRAPVSGSDTGVIPAAREPWLLATSLSVSPQAVVDIYTLRMQIEETFRDHKSHRFGWCLRHVRSRCHQRLTTLLLLAAIAMFAVTILGIAAEQAQLHRQYQANTVRRRVLSFFSLGCALIARKEDRALVPRLSSILPQKVHYLC
jgi:hypothetical protein